LLVDARYEQVRVDGLVRDCAVLILALILRASVKCWALRLV